MLGVAMTFPCLSTGIETLLLLSVLFVFFNLTSQVMGFTVIFSHMSIIILHSFTSHFLPIPDWSLLDFHVIYTSFPCLILTFPLLFSQFSFYCYILHICTYKFKYSFWIWKYHEIFVFPHRVMIHCSIHFLATSTFSFFLTSENIILHVSTIFFSIHQLVNL